ncbi:uncharacterized protein LOC106162136 [Lingula anatina]|uniref:Uncharacterized protein LOC106162136 n=1 Tax=Lingula anatina TaxID=7574 RepID=A0A1S3I967_LINAN|nr:uncharacterized protein LOC106162136 [Lingula anatina]|eukprot:XP_013394733.1 uncharacterized protein LOC106162136 [Lingula anatina]
MNNPSTIVESFEKEETLSEEIVPNKKNGKGRRKREKILEDEAKQQLKNFRRDKSKQMSTPLDENMSASRGNPELRLVSNENAMDELESEQAGRRKKNQLISLRNIPLERNGSHNKLTIKSPTTKSTNCANITEPYMPKSSDSLPSLNPESPVKLGPTSERTVYTFKEVEFRLTKKTSKEDFNFKSVSPGPLERSSSSTVSQTSYEYSASDTPRVATVSTTKSAYMEPGIWYKPPPHKGLRPKEREPPCAKTQAALKGKYCKCPTYLRQWIPSIACQYELARNAALKEAAEQGSVEEEERPC